MADVKYQALVPIDVETVQDSGKGDPERAEAKQLEPVDVRGDVSLPVRSEAWEESSEDDELQPSDENTFTARLPASSDTYGCAGVVLVYFWQDKSQIYWVVARFMSQIVNLVAQVFLLYVTKQFVTFPSVLKARALYASYHEDVFRNGEFNPDAWETWPHKSSLCQLPLSNKQFTYVMLSVWTAKIVLDLKQTLQYMSAWWALPRPTAVKRRLIVDTDDGERKAIVRAPLGLKVFVFVTIWFPKLLIALLCWWIGCRWLISTLQFGDVILNAVALVFIIEIDELLYQALEPYETQEWSDSHDILTDSIFKGKIDKSLHGPARCQAMRKVRLHYSMKVLVTTAVICFGAPVLYMRFQQAIPGYKWDVAVHCASYVEVHWKR